MAYDSSPVTTPPKLLGPDYFRLKTPASFQVPSSMKMHETSSTTETSHTTAVQLEIDKESFQDNQLKGTCPTGQESKDHQLQSPGKEEGLTTPGATLAGNEKSIAEEKVRSSESSKSTAKPTHKAQPTIKTRTTPIAEAAILREQLSQQQQQQQQQQAQTSSQRTPNKRSRHRDWPGREYWREEVKNLDLRIASISTQQEQGTSSYKQAGNKSSRHVDWPGREYWRKEVGSLVSIGSSTSKGRYHQSESKDKECRRQVPQSLALSSGSGSSVAGIEKPSRAPYREPYPSTSRGVSGWFINDLDASDTGPLPTTTPFLHTTDSPPASTIVQQISVTENFILPSSPKSIQEAQPTKNSSHTPTSVSSVSRAEGFSSSEAHQLSEAVFMATGSTSSDVALANILQSDEYSRAADDSYYPNPIRPVVDKRRHGGVVGRSVETASDYELARLMQEELDAESAKRIQQDNGGGSSQYRERVESSGIVSPPVSQDNNVMGRRLVDPNYGRSALDEEGEYNGVDHGRYRPHYARLSSPPADDNLPSPPSWRRQRYVPYVYRPPPPPPDNDIDMSYEALLELEDVSRGVDSETISQHSSTYFYADRDQTSEEKKCTVCLNEFKNCQLLRRLPCLHAFHRKCIDNWLKESSQCPVCMKDIKEHTVPSTS